MGAALTYARRHTLFALVGIAGEDDLDAPNPSIGSPPQPQPNSDHTAKGKQDRSVLHRPPTLDLGQSAQLRDQMLGEIGSLTVENELLAWAKDGLPRKNTLLEKDARLIEGAHQQKLGTAALASGNVTTSPAEPSVPGVPHGPTAALALPKEATRKRSKAHLSFVRGQPCVICQQIPSDPHHLKFAQQRTLGRKISDEFTVPLCRNHHQDLHRQRKGLVGEHADRANAHRQTTVGR